jgi:phosphogluconate dehydratase
VRFQGPRANGMPELHKLTPPLGVLQDQGFHVALVTDGRMSGASGKVPAAIHVTPECLAGGALARVRDGDVIVVDAARGVLEARVDAAEWDAREPACVDMAADYHHGLGRELFAGFRANARGAEEGAVTFYAAEPEPATRSSQPALLHDRFVFAPGADGSEDPNVPTPPKARVR